MAGFLHEGLLRRTSRHLRCSPVSSCPAQYAGYQKLVAAQAFGSPIVTGITSLTSIV